MRKGYQDFSQKRLHNVQGYECILSELNYLIRKRIGAMKFSFSKYCNVYPKDLAEALGFLQAK